MTSHTIDIKHPDMKLALEKISEAIRGAQQRRDHYKKMSPKQRVMINDRFGAQVYDADQMAWLFSNEYDTLQRVYDEVYGLFTIRVGASKASAAVVPASGAAPPPPSGEPSPRRESP